MIFCYNLNCSKERMALWCSRLARQPVTLEVDGSSPFGVAKKKTPSIWMAFFAAIKKGLEPSGCDRTCFEKNRFPNHILCQLLICAIL